MESRSAFVLAAAAPWRRLSSLCLTIFLSLAPVWAGAQDAPPCASGVGVGFSTSPIESAVPFDGLIGVAGEDEIIFEFPAEATSGNGLVYVNLASALETPEGINGWAFGVALDGDLDLLALAPVFPPRPSVSCPGSCPWPYGIIVDPALNEGQQGVVTFAALTVSPGPGLPPEGPLPPSMTQSLFGIEIGWSGGPLPESGLTATLRFQEGLVATGQPVNASITVGGGSVDICNFDVASVTIRFFREVSSPRFVRGNANGDSKVDIADAIWMLNDLFLGGPTTPCKDAADANGDGELVISDPIYLLNGQFAGGQLPPAPFPDCGTDPSGEPGPLGCESSPCP